MAPIRKLLSPNFDERAGGVQPGILVLHYTGTGTGADAEMVYLNPNPPQALSKGPVSPHYMIDRNGAITQFVAEERRAWHAGLSWWDGHDDINSHSIGIELVNPGHMLGYIDFTPPQMAALADLIHDILGRHPIRPWNIVGHSDISPADSRNKPDPGEKLNWAWLAAQGIGLFPQPAADDYAMGDALYADAAGLRQGLSAYGYDPRVSDREAIAAFQRHFQAEAYLQGTAGMPDRETRGRLHWLLQRKIRDGICP